MTPSKRTMRGHRWCLALTLALLLGACTGNSGGGGADDGSSTDGAAGGDRVLRMAWSSEILTLDPPDEAGVHGLALIHNLYENLVGYDFEAAEVVPELAEDWDISDDGLTYTFSLDPDATFASGNPVTAEDVRWTFERLVEWEEAAQGFQIRPFLVEADIEVVDERTISVTLAQPAAAFLAALAGHASSIIDSQLVAEHEVDGDHGREYLRENVAGSGPFQLDEFDRGNFYTMVRNDNYWRDIDADFDRVQMQIVQESAQQESLLRSGQVDVIFDASPDAIADLEEEGFVPSGGADVFTYYISVNQAIEPFDDLRVRQALRYAIDYDGIIDELLGGRAVKAGSVLAEGLLGYDAALSDTYGTDVDRARELLSEAGYEDGFSTELFVADDLVRGLGLPNDVIATKLQSDLAAVGIDVELRVQDINTLFPTYQEGQLPLTFWYFGPTYPDSDVIMSPHGDWETQATTRVGFDDATVTELIQSARVELDLDERARMYGEAAEIVNEESPYAFLFRPEVTPVASPELEQLGWVPIWAFDLAQTSFGG